MEARSAFDHDQDRDQVDSVVARIKAYSTIPLPTPSPEAVARFLAHTEHEAPLDPEDLEEHERMWRAVDEEVRALDPSGGIVSCRP